MSSPAPKLSRRQFLKTGLLGAASLALPSSWAQASDPPTAIFRADPPTPMVALTFDDGYGYVTRFLNTCQELNIRLTLFPLGSVIEARPELFQRALAEGHEIGCHGYQHIALKKKSYDEIAAQLSKFLEVTQTYLGLSTVRYFRPPYGSGWASPALQQAAADFGMTVVMWNKPLTPGASDPKRTWRDVVSEFRKQAVSGDIFLYHFPYTDVAALPGIVSLCSEWGWQVGTISQLIGAA